MRKLSLLLTFGLLAFIQARAVTLSYLPNAFGDLRSTCPIGGANCDPGGTPTGWTEATTGDATLTDSNLTGSSITMSCQGSGSEVRGQCLLYKSTANTNAVQLTLEMTAAPTGAINDDEGCSVFISDALAIDSDIHNVEHYWPQQNIVYKFPLGEATEIRYPAVGGYGLDSRAAITYDGTNTIEGFASDDDGVTYDILNSTTDTPASTYYYGFACNGASLGTDTNFAFDISESGTVTISDSGSPPPDPGPSPTCASIDSDTVCYEENYDPLYNVTLLGGRDSAECTTAACIESNQACGRDINFNPATISGAVNLTQVCPANDPMRVLGEAAQGTPDWSTWTSIAEGSWNITGDHIIVAGVRFDNNGNVRCRGYNNHVVGSQFENYGGVYVAFLIGDYPNPGSHCELAYVENFGFPESQWNVDCNNQQGTVTRMFVRASTGNSGAAFPQGHQYAWLHHNDSHDMPAKPCSNYSSGQSDSVENGESHYDWSNGFASNWYVERNYEHDHDQAGGGGVYDMKMGGIIVRFNTFLNNASNTVAQRLAEYSIYESNIFRPGGILRTHSRGHILVCNDMGNGYLATLAGDLAWDASVKTATASHQATYQNLVESNIGTVRIGYAFGGDTTKYNIRSNETEINNQPSSFSTVQLQHHENTTDNRNGAATYNCEPAFQLTPDQVGPAALDDAPTQWKTARGF